MKITKLDTQIVRLPAQEPLAGGPVAGGEYTFGTSPFRHMLDAGSLDIVMIDLMRVGGITQWLKVAGMAEIANKPVVSHVLPEVHVHLIAGVPNGLTVEYIAWSTPLWEEIPLMKDGELIVPDKPGPRARLQPRCSSALQRITHRRPTANQGVQNDRKSE